MRKIFTLLSLVFCATLVNAQADGVRWKIIDHVDVSKSPYQLDVYPSVVYNNIYIQAPTKKIHLRLFDMGGKKVMDKKIDNEGKPVHAVQISDLKRGSYLMWIQCEQNIITRKIIKR